ncbi:MAG: hypothetical protein DRI57_33355 [Deltaproteobacteria bacterium]|nr:MAG: hypothetical protein DRI57_33355 [Deltaproteobacteria bacterium]
MQTPSGIIKSGVQKLSEAFFCPIRSAKIKRSVFLHVKSRALEIDMIELAGDKTTDILLDYGYYISIMTH